MIITKFFCEQCEAKNSGEKSFSDRGVLNFRHRIINFNVTTVKSYIVRPESKIISISC